MLTKHLLRTTGLALTLVVAVVPGAYANPYQFAAIDVPGATITVANQVNDTGQIVGTYVDATGTHGFVQDGPTVTRIDPPGSTRTYAWGINDTGQVVGSFNDATGIHGFLKDGPNYTALDAPGAGLTAAWDINNAGQIVGEFNIVSGLDDHGFLKDGAVYTTIDVPGYAYAGAFGINNFGQIVGTFSATLASQDLHAFLKDGATLSVIDVPGATFTNPWGINDAGQITGVFQDAAGFVHGFLRDGATLSVIDFPGAAATAAFGINDRGQIIGSYDDAAGVQHSFLATPVPEPAALNLLTLGLLGLWVRGWRRRHHQRAAASPKPPSVLRPAVWALPVLLATAPAGAQVQFTVTDLGSLNATTSTAYGLNTAGQVAGYSAAPGSAARAFLWSSGTLQSLSAPGADISIAYAVSPTGQVVGFASSNGLRRAVTWRSGVMQDLGTLGGSFSDAYGINSVGQIVGDAYLAGNSTYHAYLWQPGGMQDLGTLGGSYSTARGVNAAGQVAGFSARADGSVHAFVSQSGGLQDLGTLGGSYSYANTINAAGQVVGSSIRSDGATHAFLWRSGAAMQDLGTLGGSYSAATAINAVGQVVGASSLVGTGPRHAFLRGAQGGMVDVNDLLVAGSGVTVSDAVGVNDYGQIAGAASFAGNTRAVLLTPTGSIHWLASGSLGSTGSGGNFLDGADWEQGFRPSPFLDLFIAPTGSPTIDLSNDAAIKQLILGAAAGSSGRPQLVLHDGARLSASNGVTVLATGLLSGDGTVAGRLDNFGTMRPGNLSIVGPFTNAGLVAGSGYLNANLNNAASGQVQSGSGDVLHVVGATHVNQGTLDISGGGTQQYSGPLANMAGGRILLNNAVLRLDAGLSNAGQLQVSYGGATVYGNITTQAGGKIILSGNSDTTFFDAVDVESGGELRVSAGSSAAFFGLVRQRTGAVFSGSGTKFYEGGLSIGDSPGLGIDGGSVAFGSGSTYLEEIGGTAAGLEFDKYIVSGTLGFGGTLKVVWWNAYAGQAGQRFDLFDWGHSTGTFAALDFSAAPLAGGLVWDVSQLYATGEIGISAVPEPASWALLLAGLLLWAPRRLRRQTLARTGCAAALVLAAGGASAQVWTNPSVGDWFIASNWNPFVPTGGSVNVAIDNGGLALIHSPGAAVGHLSLGGGLPGYLDVAGTGTLSVYDWLNIYRGTAEIRAGGKIDVVNSLGSGRGTEIGGGGTSRLLVTDPGSSMSAGSFFLGTSFDTNYIGFSSVLSVENGGSFDTTNVLIVNASSASVSGVNSRWTNRQYLDIDGGSSLAVRDQGAVDGGYQVDVWGAANVSTGGSLTTTGPLRLGGSADRPGLLTVQSGGLVISAGGELGYSGAGTAHSGAVAISGAGSTWFNSGVLVVGGASGNDPSYFGSGTISIDKGGWLASGASTVGNQAGAYGKVAVDGTGSRWNSSGDIVVGNLAIGIVEVTNGAQLSSVRGHVGYAAGSNGAVTVSGAGSSWAASGSLFIGNAGNGQLNVLDGAVVSTAGNSYLGFAAGSQGAATVDGAGSVWNTTAAGTNLNIGGSQTAAGGVGTLSIGPGGAVHTAAANLYATGTLLLTGDAVFTGPITAYGGTVRSIGVSSLGNAITLGTGGLSVQPRDPASTLTFSGNISGTGGLYKSNFIGTGSGTLVLTGNNTYTGATVIDIGNLLVNGTQNSMVQVNSGALGGTGAILAAVQVGNDVGTADATIAPGSGVGNGLGVGTLSTGDLNIRADGVYAFQIDSVAAAADRIVVTGGVVLASGATFSFNDTSAANVAPGTSFVAIANDDVDAIVGQFANLAQGGIFSVGANSYQASYFGGTGNDLVLTSVPVPEPARPALLLCGLVAVALWRQRRRDA